MKHMRSKQKRLLNLSRNKCHKVRPQTTIRSRPLRTQEAAMEWAKAHNFSKYEIMSAKKDTRFCVVVR